MVKKIIVCVIAVLFVDLFLACSSSGGNEVTKPREEPLNLINLGINWGQYTEGDPFPWDSIDGFFPNKKHPYGFDRHPKPKKDSIGDSIVYVSVLDGDDGKVTLKINQDYGSSLKLRDYYICDPASPYPYDTIATIDNSEREFSYSITAKDKEKRIALCWKSETGIQKVQELSIHPYKWNDDYDFYVYILGDEKDSSDRHQLLNSTNFWNLYDSVYRQAVVNHSELFGKFKAIDRGYILTRAEGIYEDSCINYSVIDEAINEINSRVESGGTSRNIIQVGYFTKRFWPLKFDKKNIQICGEPDPTTLNLSMPKLKLDTLPGSKCSMTKASVIRDENRGVWKLRYIDGTEADATKNNVNPDCMVFVDDNLDSLDIYVKEVGDALGIAYYYEKATIAIQPWRKDFTARIALHELGHTMGLADLNEEGLSISMKTESIIIEGNIVQWETYARTEEDNLMHKSSFSSDYKLRKRGIAHKDTNVKRKEYQWDCLQKVNKACANSKQGSDLP